MPMCRKCGVELEPGTFFCPLCKTPLEENHDDKNGLELQVQERMEARDEQRAFLFREIFSFFALAGVIVVGAVDLAYGADLTWSRIPLVSIGFLWIAVILPSGIHSRTYLQIIFEVVNLALFLFFLDLFTPGRSWFLNLALPLTAILGVLILKAVFLIRRFRFFVPGGIAMALLCVALFVLSLELLLHNYQGHSPSVSWSLITSAAAIPFVLFLLSLEKKLKRGGSNLEKYFHV